ncbi:MAG: DUF4296 domain-containing protein [Owenweeksia sp.]
MIVKKTFIAIALAILTASCSVQEEGDIPKDVFKEDRMITILTDIHLVEGAKLGRRIMGDTVLVDVYFQKVFEKHNITKEQFEHSFGFYSDRPAQMDKIYDRVIENLNSIEVASPRWEDAKDSVDKAKVAADTIPEPGDTNTQGPGENSILKKIQKKF